MNYFVTGLPRSRTAWFSKWLPDCLHEGIEGCFTHREYINKLSRGDSDSALMFFPIERYFPDAPVLIVERDFDEVMKSLAKIDLLNDNVYAFMKESQSRLDKMNGLRVSFDNLPFEDIWKHLIGTDFDQRESIRMDNINIQSVNYNPDVQAFKSFIGEV